MAYNRDDENDKNLAHEDQFSESDDFWQLDFMLPAKRVTAFSRDTDAVEIEINDNCSTANVPSGEKIKECDRKKNNIVNTVSGESIIPREIDSFVMSYSPMNPLIVRVAVKTWPSRYSFYNKFRSDALRLFDSTHAECSPVPFFAYMPQYNQLGVNHRAWYLWWRSNVRAGEYLDTDYTYILLYVYEIINLPDKIPAEKGIILLCDIWRAYRLKYTKLDPFMTELLCDYCLSNKIEAPLKYLGDDIVTSALRIARFKEFYTVCDAENPLADLLLAQSCSYDYRGSRFYNSDTSHLFNTHIKAALRAVIEKFGTGSGIKNEQTVNYTRDIYNNALCVYDVKRRVDIEYMSFTRSAELRTFVTGIVKYSENFIRKMIKVKAKYKVSDLDPYACWIIDEYFEPFMQDINKENEREKLIRAAKLHNSDETSPEYEKYYEALSAGLSPERALDIEKESWSVTAALTDDIPSGDEISFPDWDSVSEAACSSDAEAEDTDINSENSADELVKTAVRYLLDGNRAEFNSLAVRNNILSDTLADRINEAAYAVIGDIAVESDADGWHIIDDYMEDMRNFSVLIP